MDPYTPQLWLPGAGGGTPINPARLGTIEQGVKRVTDEVITLTPIVLSKAPTVTPTAAKTADYAAVAGDLVRMDATGGNKVVTLPTAVSGTVIAVKKTDSSVNTVTINPTGVETIDDASSAILRQQHETRRYIAVTGGWVTESGLLRTTELDNRYVRKGGGLTRVWNTGLLAPSATINTDGANVSGLPGSGQTGMVMLGIGRVVWSGTFGSETATLTLTATFSDATTASTTVTATAVGTVFLADSSKFALLKDGVYITQFNAKVKSSIASSLARVTVDLASVQN
jgi:hypothetical protein